MFTKTIFYDVDTQNDFMNEDGALYVLGAEEIKPILKEITDYARENNYPILGSVDRHFEDDAELKRNGGPFPDHCMDGTFGQKKIDEINVKTYFIENYGEPICQENAGIYYWNGEDTTNRIKKGFQVYFEKQHNDVFTNESFRFALKRMGTERAIVYGVATDYCVKAAAIGMKKRGIDVYVLEDAIKGVVPETTEQAIKEMKEVGINFVEFSDIDEILKEMHGD